MKNIGQQLQELDRDQFRRIAHGLPEQHEERPQAEKTAEILNELFNQLRATFPASMANFRTQEELNEFRRQWLLAFGENGITDLAQVAAGMRVARRQEKPFLPSPGQFVAWCRSEVAIAAGLPDIGQLVEMVYRYCRTRGQYPDAESYPWESKAHYWMVTGLYTHMRANSLSDSELRRKASDELSSMVRRLNAGEVIPEPVKRIPLLGGKPLTNEQGLNKIAEIRAKFGLGKGRHHG